MQNLYLHSTNYLHSRHHHRMLYPNVREERVKRPLVRYIKNPVVRAYDRHLPVYPVGKAFVRFTGHFSWKNRARDCPGIRLSAEIPEAAHSHAPLISGIGVCQHNTADTVIRFPGVVKRR
jgi:hypothetical protein